MKVCKYCDSECDDGEKTCHSCGASEFSNKCRNCGTVFDSGFCPNCGVKVGQKPHVCPKCGNEYYSNACPNYFFCRSWLSLLYGNPKSWTRNGKSF